MSHETLKPSQKPCRRRLFTPGFMARVQLELLAEGIRGHSSCQVRNPTANEPTAKARGQCGCVCACELVAQIIAGLVW